MGKCLIYLTKKNDIQNSIIEVRKEEEAVTHIYKNIYLRREEDALYNISRQLDSDAERPTVEKIKEYVLADTCEHIIFMDIKLNMVSRYEATNVFVDTGYKNYNGEPIFLSLVLRDDTFAGEYVGTIDHLGNAILSLIKSKVNEQEVYDNIDFLKNNYGKYKEFVDEWDLKEDEREKENNLGDISILFKDIDVSSFPENTAENIVENVDEVSGNAEMAATLELEKQDDEPAEEVTLEAIKTDKMYVYDYIPDKFYLVQCHTMLGTINFSLVNNHMDVFGNKIPLYSLFIVQYNQGTSLGQLTEDINLREYNLAIPDKVVDEISEAINYIRGYLG